MTEKQKNQTDEAVSWKVETDPEWPTRFKYNDNTELQCKYVKSDPLVYGVVGLHGVDGVSFSSVDDLVSIIQEEATEHHETTVQSDWIEAGANGRRCRQEPGTCCTMGTDRLNHRYW